MIKIAALFAVGRDGEFANHDGTGMPWPHLKQDMRRLVALTKHQVVIMGRRTWDSLPRRPLPSRFNIVVTSDDSLASPDDDPAYPTAFVRSFDEAVRFATTLRVFRTAAFGCVPIERFFVIGGVRLFAAAWPRVDEAFVTVVDELFPGSIRLPAWPFDDPDWTLDAPMEHVQDGAYRLAFGHYLRRTR